MKNDKIRLVFSTMGLSAGSDFAGFNQIVASSNIAMIYDNVGSIEEFFFLF
jgi:hypothetical protein